MTTHNKSDARDNTESCLHQLKATLEMRNGISFTLRVAFRRWMGKVTLFGLDLRMRRPMIRILSFSVSMKPTDFVAIKAINGSAERR